MINTRIGLVRFLVSCFPFALFFASSSVFAMGGMPTHWGGFLTFLGFLGFWIICMVIGVVGLLATGVQKLRASKDDQEKSQVIYKRFVWWIGYLVIATIVVTVVSIIAVNIVSYYEWR